MNAFILTNKFFKCKKFPHIKNTTDQIEALLKQKIGYYTKFLQVPMPSLTYTAIFIRTLDHFPSLASEDTYRAVKHAIRTSKKLNPYSCCLIAKFFKQFSFEGDQSDILKMLRDFTIINRYHFTPKQIDEFSINFKNLVSQKAKGPVQFLKIPNINRMQKVVSNHDLLLLNEVTTDQKNEKNNRITFQRKSTCKKSTQWVKIKVIGIMTKQIKKIQNKRIFGLSQYQYNQEIQNIMSKFTFQFKQAISHNSQAIIFEVQSTPLDHDFHQKQFKQSQFYASIDLFPLRLTTADVSNYLKSFKKTFGLVYSQILTVIQQQQSIIDPMRSLLMHINDNHKSVFLVKKDSRKQILRHFHDIKQYPLQIMEKVFTYYRMISMHELAHFCVNRQNQGCLPLPNIKKSLNKQPKCMQRQRIRVKSLSDINDQQGKHRFFMNEGDTFGEQVNGIIESGEKQGMSSFVIVCDSDKIWSVFRTLCANKKKQSSKLQQLLQDKQNLNQRLGMLKSIYASDLQVKTQSIINQSQVELFRQEYNKLIYPIKLECD